MLVRNLFQRGGTGKLRNHWEEKIHKIVSATEDDSVTYKMVPEDVLKPGDDSVTYKIVPENVMKPKDRIVHRNMLLIQR